MNKVLKKRIFREFKANFARYIALTLLIVMGMYIVVGMVSGAETIILRTEEHGKSNHIEDGQFTVFIPLNEKQIKSITDKGVTIEKMFSIDVKTDDDSTIRLFKNRKNINLVELDEGKYPENMNEAIIEKRYSEEHSLSVGSTITVSGITFTITGIGTSPDYDAPYEKMSDTAVSSKRFGTMFVTDEQYDYLINNTSQKAEDQCYAYLLNGSMSDEDLKKIITDMDFSYKNVSDRYYLEMIGEIIKKRDDLRDGINDLYDGAKELSDGLKDLYDGSKDLYDGSKDLYDGSEDLYNGSKALSDGAKELSDGAGELKNGSYELADGIKSAANGTKDLKEGMYSINNGTSELSDGISALDSSGQMLAEGANEIFKLALSMVSDSLNASGIEVSLTPDNYSSTLDTYISATGSNDLIELKAALDSIKQYADGVNEYVTGVSYVNDGSKALKDGINQVYDGTGELANGLKAASEGADALAEGANALFDGTKELSEGSKALSDGNKELSDGAKELSDGAGELSDGAKEAYNGSKELVDGVSELKDETEKIIDDVFDLDLDNLTSFVKKANNIRIAGAAGDVQMNKFAGLAAGVIIMMLFTYVISVFVIHQIQRESTVIGALYALGGKKKDLIAHYIALPTAIAFVGGLIGALLGFSKFGISLQMEDSYAYFSLPVFEPVHPLYLIIYSIIMPPVISAIVNIMVINKKLSGTALSLIKNEQKIKNNENINLKSKNFIRKFQIRQIIREMRTSITVLLSLLFSLIILMLGIDCYYLCVNIGNDTENDTKYEYMYTIKYPETKVPEGGEACYIESFSKELYGYNLDINVIGIDNDNPYYCANVQSGKNKVTISKSVAQKYNLLPDDKLILTDEASSMDYAFTVTEICDYNAGLAVFMDIKSMRELFGQKTDYYNCVLSDKSLNIENGRLYATTTRNDIIKSSKVFADLMMQMVGLLIIVSIVILISVMYLMQNIMIERASAGISLVKVFGYSDKNVKKLYLNGNTIVTAVGAIIGIPTAKIIIDNIFPLFIPNVACGLNLSIPWYIYVSIFSGIIIIHCIVNTILVRKLKKITPAEALKNRE